MELCTPISNLYSIRANIEEVEKQHNAYLTSARLFGMSKERIFKNEKFLSLTATDIISQMSPENLIECFSSGDDGKIQEFCAELIESIQKIPNVAQNLIGNEDVVNVLTESITNFSNETTLLNIINSIVELSKQIDITPLVDNGILFSTLQLVETNTEIALHFIANISKQSRYAADGVVSCGFVPIITQLINEASDEHAAIDASLSLEMILKSIGQIDRETCEPIVHDILPLLQMQNEEVVCSVMRSLSQIIENCTQCTNLLYEKRVHEMIIPLLSNENTIDAALSLAGTMTKTESTQNIQELVDCGLLGQIAEMLPETSHAPKVFRVLTSAFQSSPETLLSVVTVQFLSMVSAMSNDCEFDIYRELSNFTAVVIIYSPSPLLPSFIGTGIINSIIEMLECGVNDIVIHCLQSLYRVLSISEQDQSLGHVASIFLEYNEHIDSLENLVDSEDKFVAASAQLVLDELDKNRQEQL